MGERVFLSRPSFDKGLNDTLTLKPLRRLANSLMEHKRPAPQSASPTTSKDLVVSRDATTGAWRVRKAS